MELLSFRVLNGVVLVLEVLVVLSVVEVVVVVVVSETKREKTVLPEDLDEQICT